MWVGAEGAGAGLWVGAEGAGAGLWVGDAGRPVLPVVAARAGWARQKYTRPTASHTLPRGQWRKRHVCRQRRWQLPEALTPPARSTPSCHCRDRRDRRRRHRRHYPCRQSRRGSGTVRVPGCRTSIASQLMTCEALRTHRALEPPRRWTLLRHWVPRWQWVPSSPPVSSAPVPSPLAPSPPAPSPLAASRRPV